MFWEMSNIDKLAKYIKEDINSLGNLNLKKSYWYVVGNEKCGKSLLIENLKSIYDDIELYECNNIDQVNTSISEGVLIVLSNNHNENKELLESIKYEFRNCKKIVILNKIDEFMYEGETLEVFKRYVKKYVYETLNLDTIFISSYYIKKWRDIENEILTCDDLLKDNNIILFDKYNMPIVSFNSDKEFF